MRSRAFHSAAFVNPAFNVMGGGASGGIVSEYSVAFDGSNDYIRSPQSLTLGGTQASLSVWIKPTSTADTSQTVIKVREYSATFDAVEIDWAEGSNLVAYVRAGGVWSSPAAIANSGYTLNAWHHLAMTWDGSTIKLFTNGTHVASMSYAGTMTNSAAYECTIGNDWAGTVQSYFGNIDDVRIYNRALSAPEILALYENTTAPTTDGLVAYWPLDEGTGTNAVDTIGGNNGTLTNGPTWSTDVAANLQA